VGLVASAALAGDWALRQWRAESHVGS